MDGIHDLGGREGFGPIEVTKDFEGFHDDWEARMFCIARTMTRPDDWNIDWFRHCRELIDPVDYLSRPYYDQWLQSYSAMLISSGLTTVQEIVDGHVSTSAPVNLGECMKVDEVDAALLNVQCFNTKPVQSPAFSIGQSVQAAAKGISSHTRLPAYVRGAQGHISHLRGTHVFPDANSLGEKRSEPLYTVAFAAGDLWPDAKSSKDSVHVDMWESYLHAL